MFASNRNDIALNNQLDAHRDTRVSVAQQKIVYRHSLKISELFDRRLGHVRKVGNSSRCYKSRELPDIADSRCLMVSESNAEPN